MYRKGETGVWIEVCAIVSEWEQLDNEVDQVEKATPKMALMMSFEMALNTTFKTAYKASPKVTLMLALNMALNMALKKSFK